MIAWCINDFELFHEVNLQGQASVSCNGSAEDMQLRIRIIQYIYLIACYLRIGGEILCKLIIS